MNPYDGGNRPRIGDCSRVPGEAHHVVHESDASVGVMVVSASKEA